VRLGLGAATPPAAVAVARVLEVARRELGTVEQPTNRTKYGQWCGMDGNPWCAMFVNWVLSQAAIPGFERPVAGFPYTPRGVQLFQSGQLGSWLSPGAVALPGDVVFFSFARRDGDGRPLADHVGLVERVSGQVLHTIEGNTTSGAAGNQRNGGGVYRRTRTGSVILGYGRPRYGANR
jgi:cell wall-associated NlpC family hydrolase